MSGILLINIRPKVLLKYYLIYHFSKYYRIYTGPKDDYIFGILSKPVYKKLMENNVNLELSFNDWDVSKEKTLSEPKSAYFADTASSTIIGSKWACKVLMEHFHEGSAQKRRFVSVSLIILV